MKSLSEHTAMLIPFYYIPLVTLTILITTLLVVWTKLSQLMRLVKCAMYEVIFVF